MRRHQVPAALAALLTLAVVWSCTTGGGGGGRGELINLSACPANMDVDALAADAVALTNTERLAMGVPALNTNAALTAAAQAHAESMAIEGFTGHENPNTGSRVGDRVTAQGYTWTAVGENLEYGGCTADWVVTEWLNSTAGHREILLNPVYTDIGVGVYQGGAERTYWVQVFATPG
jgi:uncharacterized protein YkwD